MSAIEELLRRNRAYAAALTSADLGSAPQKRLAVVACMDARLDLHAILGLQPGDAVILRNAGGVITEDVIRSLFIAERLLGTREILLVQHTDCGMLKLADAQVAREITDACGGAPPFALQAFTDLDENIHESLARLQASAWIACKDTMRGFVYDVRTGRLREVVRAPNQMREAA
jgi:carbonic anhydrase